jgi:maltose alpha-D-glucosyltransferase/alpha-amylase
MLRSFHYAAQVALLERGEEADAELAELATRWERRCTDAFLEGYLDVDEVGELIPGDDESMLTVLDAFLVDKAVYEVGYELANRPSWAPIPLQGLERVLAAAR